MEHTHTHLLVSETISYFDQLCREKNLCIGQMPGAANKILYPWWKDGRVRHNYKGRDSENFKKQKVRKIETNIAY